MATSGLYGSSPTGAVVAAPGSETSGLYGSSPTGATVAAPGSETAGLYGSGVTFGGTYFEYFIFIQSETQPATPTGGSWSFTTNVGTPPSGWSNSPPPAPTMNVWASIALVNSANSTALTWSVPGQFAYAAGLPILSGADIPLSSDGVNNQLYIQTGSIPQTIWFKEAGTWTRLTGSTLYMDLVNNQTILGTKTFSSQIQGSVSGTSSNVTGIVAIANGGTGQITANSALNALLPSQATNASKVLTTDGSNTSWQIIAGSGTVTSINVSGGTTGLTTSGGPVTTSGTITLAGTLAIANGGTGSTSTTYANLASNVYGVLPVNNGGTGVNTSTGSGSVVLNTNPVLVTPALGTPTSGNFSTGTFTWPTFNQNTTGTASNVTGVVAVANGGTGATTLTGYVKGSGTSAFTASSTIPTTDLSGTITNAQLANSTISGVSLGSNLYSLTIGSGLTGTSYNGSAAVTIANSAPMVYPSAGIASSTGSAWNTSYSTTGTGTVLALATAPTLNNPTVSNYENWTGISAPTYTEGRMWYDSVAHALAYYNDSSNSTVHIGQDLQLKVINNTGSTIANGSPVYITGTSSGQTYPNIALAKADVASTSSVIGLTNGAIANGAIGYVTAQGGIDNVNTGTFTVGQVLYLSPYSAGQLMNTIPPTGITVQVGVVSYVDSSAGKIYVKQTTPLAIPASIITGQVAIANGGTGQSTAAAAITALTGTQTSGYYLRSNGTNSVLSAIQAADVPTLNQNTTGTAANVTGIVAIANGGTGASTAATARTNLGATTVGSNVFTLTNPSAITFPRFNADNTVSALDAATFRTAIGAGTGSGSVTSVAATVPSFLSISGSPITTSGTLAFGLSGTALPTTSGGTGLTSFTANGVVYASSTSALTTGSALTFDGSKLINTGYNKSSYQVSVGGIGTFESVGGAYLSYASGGNLYSMLNGSGTEDIFNYRASQHLFYIGGTEQARLTSTGLGLGTNSPGSKLDVKGTLRLSGSTSGYVGLAPAAAAGSTTYTLPSADGTANQALVTNGSGTLSWATTSTGTVTSVAASGGTTGLTFTGSPITTSGTLTLGGTLATTNGGTGLTSFTANGVVYASSSSALATGSALTFDGTNLLLGTTAALNTSATLRVKTASNPTAVAEFYGAGTNYSSKIVLANDANAAAVSAESGNLAFFTGGWTSEQMRLTSTGLGIGTSSPAFKLQVIGASNFQVNAAGTQQVLQLNNSDTTAGTQAVKLGFSSSGTTKSSINAAVYGNDYMTFNVGSDTERMRLDASGNLGIGTSSPAYKLDVSGEISNNIASSGELQNWRSGGVSVGNVWWDGSGQNFQISANKTGASLQLGSGAGVIKATLDSSGNLGLGVTPSAWYTGGPTKAMQIGANTAIISLFGTRSIFASNYYLQSPGGGDTYIANGYASQYYQESGKHIWFTAPSGTAGNAITFTQAMTLQASGGLSVGTTSDPGANNIGLAAGGKLYYSTNAWITPEDNSIGARVSGTSVVGFWTGGSERARIDSSGNLLVGATSQINGERLSVVAGASNGVYFKNTSSANYTQLVWNSGTTGDNAFIAFGTEATYTGRGGITYNRAGGLVSYNVASDYRAKDIYGPVTNSGALIDSVPVYMGKMHGATQERPMFIAHETPAYAHTGEKDAVDEHGNPVYQQMDASTLIPVMWAELQSLRKRLADAGL